MKRSSCSRDRDSINVDIYKSINSYYESIEQLIGLAIIIYQLFFCRKYVKVVPSPPPFPIQRIDTFISDLYSIAFLIPLIQVFALHGQCICTQLQNSYSTNCIKFQYLPYQLNPHQIISTLNTYQYVSTASSSISTKVDCRVLTCLLVDIAECRYENLHKKFVDVC